MDANDDRPKMKKKRLDVKQQKLRGGRFAADIWKKNESSEVSELRAHDSQQKQSHEIGNIEMVPKKYSHLL